MRLEVESVEINDGELAAALSGADARAAMLDGAMRVRDAAMAISPVATGQFRDSWVASTTVVNGMAAGQVTNTDRAAPYIEYGTSTHKAHATLRRAAEGFGA